MSKISFYTEDVSAFARALRRQLTEAPEQPSHVELLNMLVRATGYRNFQHYRTNASALARLNTPPPAADVDYRLLERLASYFDRDGRFARWPTKFAHQEPCIWVVWSKLPPRVEMSEREVNVPIRNAHTFGDHVMLRRELVNYKLVERTKDGKVYRRIERKPPAQVEALIHLLAARQPN